jgi:hypothetical protein
MLYSDFPLSLLQIPDVRKTQKEKLDSEFLHLT